MLQYSLQDEDNELLTLCFCLIQVAKLSRKRGGEWKNLKEEFRMKFVLNGRKGK